MSQLDKTRHKDKHGKDLEHKQNKIVAQDNNLVQRWKQEVYLNWTDEFDAADIFKFISENEVIDGTDLRLDDMMESNLRIGPKHQLGDWIEVDVDADRRVVSCNCEDFNADGYCFHQATFDVLQFSRLPKSNHQLGHEIWEDTRTKCIQVLKKNI